jgi:hypothetical protein
MLSPPPSTAHVLERASARIDGPAILHQLQSNTRVRDIAVRAVLREDQ